MLSEFGLSRLDAKRFKILLRPSWLSGFCCIFLGLAIVAIVVASYLFDGSWLQQLFDEWRNSMASDALRQGVEGVDSVTRLADGVNNALTFVLWAFVGILVYTIVASVVGSVRYTRQLNRELDYHNVNRNHLLVIAGFRIAVRCAIILLWFTFTVLFFKKVFFFCLLTARLGAENGLDPKGIALVSLSLIVLSVCLHLHVVFLRSLLLRPRLFA